MQCYSCRKYDTCSLDWKCSDYMYDCSAYELEQTNEEWLHTLNTERLADFLFGMAFMCSYCGDESHSTKEKTQQCHFGKCGCQRKDWEWWLKEKHHDLQTK